VKFNVLRGDIDQRVMGLERKSNVEVGFYKKRQGKGFWKQVTDLV
jgi:hypothetical protein